MKYRKIMSYGRFYRGATAKTVEKLAKKEPSNASAIRKVAAKNQVPYNTVSTWFYAYKRAKAARKIMRKFGI